MGYYSILKYFIRRLFYFLRSITGKLFIIFVLLFCCLILYMCIDKGVFAVSNYTFYETYFNDNDVSAARSKIGDSIWNNTDYDIYLIYDNDFHQYKEVFYFNASTLSSDTIYKINTSSTTIRDGMYIMPFFFYNTTTETSVNNTASDYHILSLYNNGLWNQNYATFAPSDNPSWGTNLFADNSSRIYIKVIRSHYDFLDFSGNLIYGATDHFFINPFIENESSTINNWSFDYLNINSGSVGYVYYDELLQQSSYANLNLKYTYDGITYTQSIPTGFLVDWSDDNFTLEIPRTWLLSNINIQNGKSVDFYLEVKKQNVSDNIYFLGSYTFSLTSDEQEQIQQDSDKALQGEILQSQQQTNNKLDSLDNTINDSSIEDITSDSLPSDTTTDITADGVNGIFTSIYNAFCVGSPQDIVFPIPFTDKSIILSPSYISNALSNSGATFIITIIQAFWWYIISRFIIKDIMNKINKIKSGNIEDIETNNIRGDML